MKSNAKTPLWETLAMVAAFALLWAWIAARHIAAIDHTALGAGWTVVQLASVAVLIAILIVRLRRVAAALREIGRPGSGGPSNRSGQNGHPHK